MSDSPQASSVRLNRSVQRIVRLLKMLATDRQGMTVGELAQATGLPESTVYRLLLTLTSEGMAERAADGSGRYQMGLEMFRLGSIVLDRLGIGQNVLSDLEELAASTGETVNLGALHGFNVLYLQKVESQHTLRASLTVGSATVPAHCSASGKVLLAFAPSRTLERLLDTNTLIPSGPNTITDRDQLMMELQVIRERGYSVDNLEFAADIRAIGAPIRDHTGASIAGLAIAGPASRISLEAAHTFAPTVMSMARRISTKLGYRG